jgi:DUF2075 family protein
MDYYTASKRAFYTDSISVFLERSVEHINYDLEMANQFSLELTQRDAWQEQISILKDSLQGIDGHIFFEFSIPRMGHRADVVLLISGVVFVLEFKCGSTQFPRADVDQVWDYALDFVNFHEPSHHLFVVPILIATRAGRRAAEIVFDPQRDHLVNPIKCGPAMLKDVIQEVLSLQEPQAVDADAWYQGGYKPTPTIIEAATKLYRDHSVLDIARSDATAINLSITTAKIDDVIEASRHNDWKSICFVTGVPGAGKTLVGLNVATKHQDKNTEQYSVFLSGNGPLVAVLREALTRDRVHQDKLKGVVIRKGDAANEVKAFIQNVHNFRDECIKDTGTPPEHVVLFDEAQRAWDKDHTSHFMQRRKHISGWTVSEPDYLISCMDRWQDWAVIVCLVGGGQEINTGEAGIEEWLKALRDKYSHWRVYVSDRLTDSEYRTTIPFEELGQSLALEYCPNLHLQVSLRSFRAEALSRLVKELLEMDVESAVSTLDDIRQKYPIVITRSKHKAMQWLRSKARGNERYGIVVSSQAERLKPLAINVKAEINPVHWFLNDRDDVRSSYYLEDVATEFHIQGLELDWVCVTWDADLRVLDDAWDHWSFKGHKWERIRIETRQKYQINAYRVLLTRARQGMVICVPEGDADDHTRPPRYYDPIYHYLQSIGFEEI